jgi:uncharacterized protein (DUF2235 family)
MAKQLVVCCDGTWNVPDERHGGIGAPTNVAKLALGVVTGEQSDQLLFYEPGVGTSPDDRLVGGAFGYGLSHNIRSCYRFLAESYEPGDNLFLFGFSRGAYTARSLAGLMRNCGILLAEHADQVDEAFAFYRDRTSQTHPSALASQIFRQMYSHDEAEIHFIGVWDTVGALGIPAGLPAWKQISNSFPDWEQLWGFHDTQLSSHVKFAYHALAIDEQREPFRPTLWTQDVATPGQTVEQVWFAGVHSEVGGGSADASLSDIALLWMIERAKACGLMFKPDQLELGASDGAGGIVSPNYAAKIVDSRRGIYELLRPYHRLKRLPVGGAPGQSLASSVVRRHRERIERYSPPGLRSYLDALGVTQVVETLPAPSGSAGERP